MDITIHDVVIDCRPDFAIVEFWCDALGYKEVGPRRGQFVEIQPKRGIGIPIVFQAVPEAKDRKNRLHLDLESSNPDDEAARLIRLGATHLRRVDEGDGWLVMADPEGNEFCLARRE